MPGPASAPILLHRMETPLGPMVGGATGIGVCLCEFADRGGEEQIKAQLEERRERPAVWEGSLPPKGTASDPRRTHLDVLHIQLREYYAGTRRRFDLPLDQGGTPWQRKVWGEILRIPYGTTLSYGELASRLGNPGGSRAVGRANGQNCVAIVIPCHRVVQADGGLRGYGGGLHRKRWLLDLEAGSRQLSF